jgi:hypothetical protein
MKIPQTGHRPHRRRGDAHYAHYESLEGHLNGSPATRRSERLLSRDRNGSMYKGCPSGV